MKREIRIIKGKIYDLQTTTPDHIYMIEEYPYHILCEAWWGTRSFRFSINKADLRCGDMVIQ